MSTQQNRTALDAQNRYGSDVIVDLLRAYEIEYVAFNPGASFRGLHDSLVNYGEGAPGMILCQHEGIAVGIAHGYSRARGGRPMAAILHDVVGLLNGALSIYQAFIDRAPVLVMGGTGPISTSKRRPGVDWRHTANVQGNAVREFVKWDDQPFAIADVPHSFARAYRVAMTEPTGPIYLCFDADLQEDPIDGDVVLPTQGKTQAPTRMAADPAALDRVAGLLVAAERPVIVTEFLGRDHSAPAHLIRLAESLAIPVISQAARPNFPTCHPLNLTGGSDVLREADLVLALDCKELERPTVRTDKATRESRSLVPDGAKWIEIGFADLEIGSWASDHPRLMPTDISILADTSLAVPALAARIEERVQGDDAKRRRIEDRSTNLHERHRKLRAEWLDKARTDWDAVPMTTGRLVLELWDAIKGEDWVLSGGHHIVDIARQLWNIDKPYRFPGGPMGPGSQIGLALGTALANKGTGRFVIDLQPDGDLMFDAGALWVAAKHEIPMLVVMYNNRAYYNDWEHQVDVAKRRGTSIERASIGLDLHHPPPDFAQLARSMGGYGEGPIEDPRELAGALRRAIAQVKAGRLALVDAITRAR